MSKLIVLSLSFIAVAHAAGGSNHHSSPLDLIPPFVNFGILFGFLAWKLAPVFKNHFSTKHKVIKETAERAQTLKFEAQMQLEQQQKKNETLSKKIEEIKGQAEKEVDQYKKEQSKENELRIAKLKEDAEGKIEMQKHEYISVLKNEIVNLVINKTKETVKSQKELKGNVESNLMQGLK